jgi:hypothetical protein
MNLSCLEGNGEPILLIAPSSVLGIEDLSPVLQYLAGDKSS